MMDSVTDMFSKHPKPNVFFIIVMISCYIIIIAGSELCKQISVEDINNSRNNSMATGYVFKSMEISSLLKCMEFCLQFRLCKSVSSSEKEKFCNLNVRTNSEAPNAMKEKSGTTFINKMDILSVLATGCGNNPCGNDSVCLVNKKGDPICIPLFQAMRCNAPPTIDNARMELENPLTVGSTVHYFCNKGYNGSGDNMITCMDGTMWSSSTFKCNRTCNSMTYILLGDTCYAFKTTLKTWEEAELNCRNDGAQLVSIETEEEFELLKKQVLMMHGGDVFSITTFTSNWSNPVNLAPYGVTFVDRTWFSFYVKGSSDTFEHLLVANTTEERHYAVCLGCYGNGRIRIFDIFPDGQMTEVTYITKYSLLDAKSFRPFWIGYENGHIEVGKGLKFGYNKLLRWTSPSPRDVKYVAITGWKIYDIKWKVSSGRHYWTYGNFNPTSGRDDYVWGTGENATSIDNGFTNWDPESSRTTTDKRCVSLDTQWNKGGTWIDEICSQKHFYICEEEM